MKCPGDLLFDAPLLICKYPLDARCESEGPATFKNYEAVPVEDYDEAFYPFIRSHATTESTLTVNRFL